MFEINLNSVVRFELTPRGRVILERYYREVLGVPAPPELADHDYTLWEVLRIFGPHVFHGMPQTPFVGNRLLVKAVTED